MYLIYNLGTEDHPIGEEVTSINDGKYHVLKFTRSGPNATLQLDNYEVRSRNPKGKTIYFWIKAHSKTSKQSF